MPKRDTNNCKTVAEYEKKKKLKLGKGEII